MKNSLKGALWSGLVFPGFGQVVLKHYKRGIVLIIAVFASLILIASEAVQHAFAILESIESEGGIIDIKTIADTAGQTSSTSDNLIYNLGFLFIVSCWLFGTVDAYRIGKKKDLEGN